MKPSNAISLYLSYAQDIGAKIDHGLRFTLPCAQLIEGLLEAWRVARGGGPGLVDIGEMGRIYGKTHGKTMAKTMSFVMKSWVTAKCYLVTIPK